MPRPMEETCESPYWVSKSSENQCCRRSLDGETRWPACFARRIRRARRPTHCGRRPSPSGFRSTNCPRSEQMRRGPSCGQWRLTWASWPTCCSLHRKNSRQFRCMAPFNTIRRCCRATGDPAPSTGRSFAATPAPVSRCSGRRTVWTRARSSCRRRRPSDLTTL